MTARGPSDRRPEREPGQWDPGQREPGQWEPGQWVRHPAQPGWGAGQVQSAIGHRVTVMFEDAGKVLIDASVVALRVVDGPDGG